MGLDVVFLRLVPHCWNQLRVQVGFGSTVGNVCGEDAFLCITAVGICSVLVPDNVGQRWDRPGVARVSKHEEICCLLDVLIFDNILFMCVVKRFG